MKFEMPSFFLNSTSSAPQTLAAGENGFVGTNGVLYTETAQAVTVSGSSSLSVLGAVATATAQAAVRTSANIQDFTLNVGAQGTVMSGLTDAVRMGILGTFTLNNAGLISGDRGVYLTGDTVTAGALAMIQNTGTITSNIVDQELGAAAVMVTSAFATVNIINAGLISANDTSSSVFYNGTGALDITNTGTILSQTRAIRSAGDLYLDNSGDITGLITAFRSMDVFNSGTITGELRGVVSIDLWNGGKILGDIDLGLSGNIINSGQIFGNIDLGVDGWLQNLGGTISGIIRGGSGNNFYQIDSTDLRIVDNSGGDDLIEASVSITLATGIEDLRLVGIVGLQGTGNNLANEITGTDSSDTLQGRTGNDTLVGLDGDDQLFGGRGDDNLNGWEGDNTLFGGEGNDRLTFYRDESSVFSGGLGEDTLLTQSFVLSDHFVINLATGIASRVSTSETVMATVQLAEIEHVETGEANDMITGNAQGNRLSGQAGDDLLDGLTGDDSLYGGSGFDRLIGGAGNDLLDGGSDNDTLDGGAGDDALEGGTQDDSMIGGNGNDLLTGGGGNDTLDGGNGNDFLVGGAGADVLIGGAGFDVFVFTDRGDSPSAGFDRIEGFDRVRDLIDIEVLYGDENAPVDVPFVFLGTGDFTGAAPELRYETDSFAGTTTIRLRYLDSLTDDLVIQLNTVVALTSANFAL